MVNEADIPSDNEQSPDFDVDQIVRLYKEAFSQTAKGPQIEGLQENELVKVASDERSIWVTTANGRVPILTPLENNAEYNQDYFDRYSDQQPYFFASKLFEGVSDQDFFEMIDHLRESQGLIITDYEVQDDFAVREFERRLQDNGIRFEKLEFIDPRNGSPAAVPHFAGKGIAGEAIWPDGFVPAKSSREAFDRLKAREPERYNTVNGVALVGPEDITDEFMSHIWEMYEAQFTQLISENPSMQAQTKDDLEKTIRSDSSLILAVFNEGKPISIGYFIADIQNAYWLRPEFYAERFPQELSEDLVWYFPGIVTKPGFEGQDRATEITDLGTNIAYERHIEPVITFQCTNISKDYVPQLVKFAVEQTHHYTINLEKIAEYRYVGYSFPPSNETE